MTPDGRPVLLFACEGVPPERWASDIRAAAPEVELRIWPDGGDPAEVDFGFAWANPPGFWRGFPHLRMIFSLGAGVDSLLLDPDLPDAPIVRMLDPNLAEGMSEFVLMRTLHHHRSLHRYERQQREQVWRAIRPPLASERTVGIMGMGELGRACARSLLTAGFRVRGWARTVRPFDGVEMFGGDDGLAEFAAGCEILVCLLPLTPQTEGVLNADLFARLPKGACLISVGRGAHLNEADLLAALESGQIEAATLDVFRQEPLPKGHPFWSHPAIAVIPHAAAFTYPQTAAPVLADNLRRALRGEPVEGLVDRAVGY